MSEDDYRRRLGAIFIAVVVTLVFGWSAVTNNTERLPNPWNIVVDILLILWFWFYALSPNETLRQAFWSHWEDKSKGKKSSNSLSA